MSVIKNKDKHGNLIEFRPADNKYRYKVNGEVKPGVTGLIGKRFAGGGLMWWAEHCVYTAIEQIMKKDKKPIDETQQFRSKVESRVKEIMAEARDIGTNMHKMAEDYINKKEIIQPSTEPLKTMFDKFTKWWAKKGFEVIATETTCYSQELDVCGTFDVVVKNKKGKVLLLDFKTSKDFYPDQPIQIATYKKLIEDSTNLKIDSYGIVKIPKDPTQEVSLRMYKPKPTYLKGFKACKFLDTFERDFLKRNNEYNKLKKGKKNVSTK